MELKMNKKWIAALPVYNESSTVHAILDEVKKYSPHVLVVNDGSTDGTSDRLSERSDINVLNHPENKGYGAALKTAFQYAIDEGYEIVVTLDCDGQHQPKRIPRFVAACRNVDIVSGSRYLKQYPGDSEPPAQRLFINKQITKQINNRFGLQLTDAFCGFKAYRTSALKLLNIQDDGYAMPLELWTQAAMLNFRILEIPVPLLYLDLNRSFGGSLDQAETRLAYYNQVLDKSVADMEAHGYSLSHHQKMLDSKNACCGQC